MIPHCAAKLLRTTDPLWALAALTPLPLQLALGWIWIVINYTRDSDDHEKLLPKQPYFKRAVALGATQLRPQKQIYGDRKKALDC
jgi:hypothetical protein